MNDHNTIGRTGDDDDGKPNNDIEMEEIGRMLSEANEEPAFDKSETECGWWCFRGKTFQRFANKRVLVIYFGLTTCLVSATFSYFTSTITTVEKRFKIPSRNAGYITVSNEVTLMLSNAAVAYYAGKGWHKPHWMAFGYIFFAVSCFVNFLPHLIYGPGQDSLDLTYEYGGFNYTNTSANTEDRNNLCDDSSNTECEEFGGSYIPQGIFMLGHVIAGCGMGFYEILSITYMDDNIKRTETASFISNFLTGKSTAIFVQQFLMKCLQYFFRILGPALGYTLGSIFTSIYIAPNLTPTITKTDPRWMGAWWLGWIIFSILVIFLAIVTAMLPRRLPETVAQMTKADRFKMEQAIKIKISFKETLRTLKRLLSNQVLVLNNVAVIFYIFGMLPFHYFAAKYIEIQYRTSASTANLVTGNFSLVFSAFGILISGFVITKLKPTARHMAAWNTFIGLIATLVPIVFIFLGCESADNSVIVNSYATLSTNSSIACNAHCECDLVKYSPVCGEDGFTYISPCHAGCKIVDSGGEKEIYKNCSCITPTFDPVEKLIINGQATSGPCEANCYRQLILFLIILSIKSFFGATARATNFLIYLRCVDEKDKTAALAYGSICICIFAGMPAPIIFGSLIDSFCILWGKTCETNGNCWIYDSASLRFYLNIAVSSFVFLACCCDFFVWFFVKDLNIYDDTQTFGTQIKEKRKLKPNESNGANPQI